MQKNRCHDSFGRFQKQPVSAAIRGARTALEPVLMLGVSLLQDLDGVPDRQAVEMLRYHAGWNFALNRQLGDPMFHPSSLVNFRNRLGCVRESLRLALREVAPAVAVRAGCVAHA